jgi:hypothetical protein
MHAAAASDPIRQFYQALELQWECLARQAEREAVNGTADPRLIKLLRLVGQPAAASAP